MTLKNIIGVEEAAKITGLSPGTVKNYCAEGRIKAKKIGKTWTIDKNNIWNEDRSNKRQLETTPPERYYLLDLERLILTGINHYWKKNRHGYVKNINDPEIGIFDESTATEIVKNDFDKRTIMLNKSIIEKILKN